jgi:hypothetical protein
MVSLEILRSNGYVKKGSRVRDRDSERSASTTTTKGNIENNDPIIPRPCPNSSSQHRITCERPLEVCTVPKLKSVVDPITMYPLPCTVAQVKCKKMRNVVSTAGESTIFLFSNHRNSLQMKKERMKVR